MKEAAKQKASLVQIVYSICTFLADIDGCHSTKGLLMHKGLIERIRRFAVKRMEGKIGLQARWW